MRPTVHVLWVLSLLVIACETPPADKVARRATVAEMPGPEAAPPVAALTLSEAVPVAVPSLDAVEQPACVRLLDRACEALGNHSDECQEARRLKPRVVTPEQNAGCRTILEVHVESRGSGKRGRRLNPCRRLIRAVCRDAKASTWACKQTRADASRLWRTGKGEACLGDLLVVEARGLLSVRRPVE
jgi:hypothetical protein